jgi:hypothetical protein
VHAPCLFAHHLSLHATPHYPCVHVCQNMAAFTIGYQNGYSDAKKANKPGGQGFAAAYKTGLNKGLSHEENHLQFLASMKRAKEAYYAATGSGFAAGGGGGAQYAPMNPIDTGSL